MGSREVEDKLDRIIELLSETNVAGLKEYDNAAWLKEYEKVQNLKLDWDLQGVPATLSDVQVSGGMNPVWENGYKPLPAGLKIKDSPIHGQGLFVKKKHSFRKNYQFGVSHEMVNGKCKREELGGFLNHSDTPNCRLTKTLCFTYLETKVAVSGKEELTVDYRTHPCGGNTCK